MTAEIKNLVDRALEEDEGPSLARIGAKIPRPSADALPLRFDLAPYQASGGRWRYGCDVRDEDGEAIASADGHAITGTGDDPREALSEAIASVEESIDAICDRYEFQRDTSDEAMRATHPREA